MEPSQDKLSKHSSSGDNDSTDFISTPCDNIVSETINLSQTEHNILTPLQSMTLPPLPPTPDKNKSNDTSSEYPPLPSENDPDGCTSLKIQPPPPPPEAEQTAEKISQNNTSANQVQDMELSDGEDDGNDQETPIFSGEFNQDEKTDTSNTVHKQIATQIVSESVVYNNDPQIYQPYYQNYPQMFQGQNIEAGEDKIVHEATVNSMSDALTSFYSDLASIDKSTDTNTSLRDVKSSCMSIGDPLPVCSTTTQDVQIHCPVTGTGASAYHSLNPVITVNENTNADKNWNRAITPDGGTEGKEKRKKKTKVSSGLSMKKKGVSSLVAKWQNIQDESSSHRPK